jgi:hypothetical protein
MSSFTRDEAHATKPNSYVESLRIKIFDKADLEERTGYAMPGIRQKTFDAATSFPEILQPFYKNDDESEEREETPGGHGEEAEESVPEEKEEVEYISNIVWLMLGLTVVDDEEEEEEEPSTLRILATEQDEEEPSEVGTEVENPSTFISS